MTNFDIFSSIPQFDPFASVAVSAERILHIDPSACVLNCRRAMEFAVKWDVLGGQGAGHALSGHAGELDEHRGLP